MARIRTKKIKLENNITLCEQCCSKCGSTRINAYNISDSIGENGKVVKKYRQWECWNCEITYNSFPFMLSD